jgi:ribosomal protein S12 methylthiotransferase
MMADSALPNTGLNSHGLRYFLDPFGCAKNQVDAEHIMASLNLAGWTAVPDPDGADLIIVNSCGFLKEAKLESINAVLSWKKQYPGKKILLTGCLVQRYGAELKDSLTEADGFAGCNAPLHAADIAAGLFNLPASASPSVEGCSFGARPLLSLPGSAYVKIAEGCNNRCSYCAIPVIRGPLKCRAIPDIIEECRQLLTRGVKELCLIGQDLASFTPSLLALLKAIAAIPGDFWVRLLYLHPDHFPLEILPLFKEDSRFLPYFDIPVQHSSPRLLSLMGRRGGADSYLKLFDSIRSVIPDAVLRSTFLVGFPGETEKDFKELLAFQEQAAFDWLGVFAYSMEEGTPAYAMKKRVFPFIARRRKTIVEKTQVPITEGKMSRFIGRAMDVLIEEEADFPMEGSPEAVGKLWIGRLFCQAPEVDGATIVRANPAVPLPVPAIVGEIVRGRVNSRAGFDLEFQIM